MESLPKSGGVRFVPMEWIGRENKFLDCSLGRAHYRENSGFRLGESGYCANTGVEEGGG